MKALDLKMVAAFLNERLDLFAEFLEERYEIDAETEAGVIVENLEIASDVLLMMEQHTECALQGAIRAAGSIGIKKIEVSGEGIEALMTLPPGRFELLHQELM